MGRCYETLLQIKEHNIEILQDHKMNHKEIERWYRIKNLRKATQALILMSILALISGFAISKYAGESDNNFKTTNVSSSGIKVEKFTYSSVGANQWDLEAESALVAQSMDHVELKSPKIVYHGGGGGTVFLNADSGELNKKSGSIKARGAVTINYKDFKFFTDDINYSQGALVAHTADPIFLEGSDMKLSGRGLRLSLDREEIIIEQDVKASLFNVKWVEPGKRLPM